jgi:hypothetical protein
MTTTKPSLAAGASAKHACRRRRSLGQFYALEAVARLHLHERLRVFHDRLDHVP